MPDNSNEIRRIAHWQSIYSNNAASGIMSPDEVAGLKFWLDPSDNSTVLNNSDVAASDSEGVKTIQDKSSSGLDITQTNPALQPTYLTSPSYLGAAAMYFDGTETMKRTVGAVIAQGNTSFAVFAYTDPTSTGARIYLASGNDLNLFCGQASISGSDSSIRTYAGADIAQVLYATQAAHLTCVEWNGASTNHYKDGSASAAASGNAGTGQTAGLALGAINNGTLQAKVEIGEILVYDSILGAADRAAISRYLVSKWGI